VLCENVHSDSSEKSVQI